jgi:hypothetical protein
MIDNGGTKKREESTTMRRCYWAVVCSMLVAAAVGIVGCESTETSESTITVTPSSQSIAESDGTVVFAASAANTNGVLVLPLVWSVSAPNLGSVVSSGGLGAVYRRNGTVKGGNAVIVSDQAGAEGVASVNQL